MKRWWLSWEEPHIKTFEYHGPWWISGEAGDESFLTVCAAVVAETENDARRIIRQAHDVPSRALEWRFCSQRESEWDPWSDRFQRADWMKWPVDGDELNKLRSTA